MSNTKIPAKFIRLYSRKKKYWNATQTEARRSEIVDFVERANSRFPGAFSLKETSHAFCVVIDKSIAEKRSSFFSRLKLFFRR